MHYFLSLLFSLMLCCGYAQPKTLVIITGSIRGSLIAHESLSAIYLFLTMQTSFFAQKPLRNILRSCINWLPIL